MDRLAREEPRVGAPREPRATRSRASSRPRPSCRPPRSSRDARTPRAAAKAALFAAEASDWFWWFGDDHTSAHDAVFDELFRRHLAAAYRAAGRPVPAALLEPVDPARAAAFEAPLRPLWPAIDGADDGAETGWEGAGRASARPQGTMHRGAGLVKEVLFGASSSGDPLFLRLEPGEAGASALAGLTLRVELLVPGADEPAVVRGSDRVRGSRT